jgi:predicted DNA-binding transcriptional regulator AlpA
MGFHEKDKTPIWQITIGDFERLLKKVVDERVSEAVKIAFETRAKLEANQTEDIIGIKVASKLTGLSVATLYSKVSRFEIPTISRGRPLRFSRQALVDWLEDRKPKY